MKATPKPSAYVSKSSLWWILRFALDHSSCFFQIYLIDRIQNLLMIQLYSEETYCTGTRVSKGTLHDVTNAHLVKYMCLSVLGNIFNMSIKGLSVDFFSLPSFKLYFSLCFVFGIYVKVHELSTLIMQFKYYT